MKRILFLCLIAIVFQSCSKVETHQDQELYHHKPWVKQVSVIHDKMIVLTIQAGEMEPSRIIAYEKQEGDSVVISHDAKYGFEKERVLYRNGEPYGWLTGEHHERLTVGQQFRGDTLNCLNADNIAKYKITASGKADVQITNVFRKSKANNWLEPSRKFCVEHKIYLQLEEPLREDISYDIQLEGLNTEESKVLFDYNARKILNEAIHVSAIGYHSTDNGKKAFLSAWIGNGGSVEFSDVDSFHILDASTLQEVYTGRVELSFDHDDVENMYQPKSFGKTNVYNLDFNDFNRLGEYKIYIESLGCSYPFVIDNNVWDKAMKTAMKGFYHIRANIAMGEPYTKYNRPEGYFPGKQVTVYQTNVSLLNAGDGLNALNTDTDNFGNILKNKTNIVDTLGWGGYHDAGDWDRRIQHLYPSRWHLELYELFPEYYDKLTWNIPESGNNLPDIIDEALYNLDFYRRLQTAEGGIRGGIEAAMHPVEGEVSWMESLDAYLYAPDMWCSFIYAGVSARAAYLLKDIDQEKAKIYAESAQRAMDWGEEDFKRWMRNDTLPRRPEDVFIERSMAALEMYRLTENSQYEKMFLEYSYLSNYNRKEIKSLFPEVGEPNKHMWDRVTGTKKEFAKQRDAYFLYTLLPQKLQNPDILAFAKELIVADGDFTLGYQQQNAYNLAAPDQNRPIMVSFLTTPMASNLCRAHKVTNDPKYLKGLYQSTYYALGAGPNNLVYMTGLSDRSPQNLFHIDIRLSGQPIPEGLVSYGHFDWSGFEDKEFFTWPIKYYLHKVDEPHPYEWPIYETFHDIYRWIWMDEWTPMESLGPNAYNWGYIAGESSN